MKRLIFVNIALLVWVARAQNPELPTDFRQHTLTDYNSSFINPAFSLTRNNPESIALWTRWQWQGIDSNPSTYFLNYTRKINPESAFAVAFFQHNTGLFLDTGGVGNYAYAFKLSERAQLALGANVYAFQRKLADDRFNQDPDMILPIPDETNDFILQFGPGVLFILDNFNLGFGWENLWDYNLSTNESVSKSGNNVFLASASVDIPVEVFGFSADTYVRPILYWQTIPSQDNQVGLNALFSTPKFWVQAGYNNFYGISTGIGGRFFKKFSLGALMEFGTSPELDGLDPTIEVVASFFIGPQFEPKEEMPIEEEEPEELEEEITEEEKRQEELAIEAALAREAELARQKEEERLSEEARKVREQFVNDSIRIAKLAEAEAARKVREQFINDSLQAAKLAEAEAARKQAELQKVTEKEEKPKAGEKYQEVTAEDGLQPGYYLVANVFGTKRYYEAFMKTLSDMGIEPKSFFRSVNKYNYVYLERYNSMQEARKARDSNFNGRYKGDTWIFRVKAD